MILTAQKWQLFQQPLYCQIVTGIVKYYSETNNYSKQTQDLN